MGTRRATLIIPSLAMGGAERIMAFLANDWAARGIAVTLLTFDDGRVPPFFPLDARVAHHPLGLIWSGRGLGKLTGNLSRIVKLRRAMRGSRPDAVLSFMESTNVLAILASLGAGIRIVAAERSNPEQNHLHKAWKLLRPFAYRFAAQVVVQTEGASRHFRPWLNGRLAIIPNPVPAPANPADDGRREPVVICLGRLLGYKGFDLAIRAFAKAGAAHPGWRLRIHGEGPARASLEALSRELGIADRVELPGATRDAHGALARGGIFALPSRFEGFPNALCEAMACGLPVVAADCAHGPREIIRAGEDGLLVPAGDADAMAAALSGLMADPDARRRLGEAARLGMSRFSPERVVASWDEVMRIAPRAAATHPDSALATAAARGD